MTYTTMSVVKKRSGLSSSTINNNNIVKSSQQENVVESPKTIDESTKTHPTAYLIFGSLLLDLLAFTMILPLLPSMLEYYKQNDVGGLYGYLSDSISSFQEWVGAPKRFNSVLFGGALGSMFSLLQFIVSPIAGGLSDFYGRKPVLIVCAVSIDHILENNDSGWTNNPFNFSSELPLRTECGPTLIVLCYLSWRGS